VDKLTDFLASYNKTPRVRTNNYVSTIYIFWNNAGDSSDFFEFSLVNEYTIGHFSFYGGEDSVNQNAMKIAKNNPYLFIFCYSNINGIYDSYNPMPSYDINNLYFQRDVMESYNYFCEIENVVMNSKSGAVTRKK
jgi:hypothetical protein